MLGREGLLLNKGENLGGRAALRQGSRDWCISYSMMDEIET